MPQNNSPHDVFISYSRKNKDKVLPIKDEIERALGLRCWIDLSDIPCGSENFKRKVIPGIKETRIAFLFFLSAESQASEYAIKEIGFASKRANKRVILIRFNDDDMTDDFYFDFQNADIIDWRQPEQKEKLLKDLSRWMAESSVSNAAGGVVAEEPKMIKDRLTHLDKAKCPSSENSRSEGKRQRAKGKRLPRIDLECHYRLEALRRLFGGYLLAVKNGEREPIDIAIAVSNGRRRKVLRGIVPGGNSWEEFGDSTGLSDWCFKCGDHGTIKVVGYSRMLKFEIGEKGSVSCHE